MFNFLDSKNTYQIIRAAILFEMHNAHERSVVNISFVRVITSMPWNWTTEFLTKKM